MIMNNQPEKDGDVHSNRFIDSTRQTGDPGKGKQVSLLINHGYYFLRYVFILVEDTGFRLVVIHQGNVLTFRRYNSLRAARTSFARLYNRKAWQKGVKANWSQVYNPEQEWLDDKLALIERVAPATHDVTNRYSSQEKSFHENKIFMHSNTEEYRSMC